MTRRGRIGALLAAAAAGTAMAVRLRGRGIAGPVRGLLRGRIEPGGRVIPCARGYDAWSATFLGPLFRRIAGDVAAVHPPAVSVLDVGCGPAHLAIRLAREHGLRVTAVDLDPAMVARATRNVERAFGPADDSRPAVVQGDVADLPFAEGSFDLVVSTFSMHHWADPAAGLTELHRVLRPGGRALIWDFVPSIRRLEGRPVPAESLARRARSGTRRCCRGGGRGGSRSPSASSCRRPMVGGETPGRETRMPEPVRAYVGLGANLGDASATIAAAIHALAALPSATLLAVSGLYATRPVGLTGQPDFRNAVVALDVPPGPDPETGAIALLIALKGIERALGRQPRARWGPREVDLDLLLFGDAALDVERPPEGVSLDPGHAARLLSVPHPGARGRLFVLAPLADLAPSLVPPGWSETVSEARDRRREAEGPGAVRLAGRWDGDAWIAPVAELRVALTVDDLDGALAFYCDALGLPVIQSWATERGRGVILAGGEATLELVDAAQAGLIDEVEVGRRVAGPVRLAFRVPDVDTATRAVEAGGGGRLGGPVLTPWGDRNARIVAPGGMQLTLWSEPPGSTA